MGTDTEFGRPNFWPGEPVQPRVGRSRPAVTPRYGDGHDVRYSDQERLTSNVQLSTFNGVTERAQRGRDMGTDTEFGATEPFGPVDLSKRRSDGPTGCGAQIWGQTRCPVFRSGTLNVQRSTLNFQRGDRKGAAWAGYGDGHVIWTTGLLTRWT